MNHPASLRPVLEEFEPRILYAADFAPLVLAGLADVQLDAAQAEATASREIAFVDLALPDAQTLIDDLQAQAHAGRPIEVVVLDAGVDGLATISATLAGRHDVTAVHLLGHGSDGVLQLGSSRLDAATLLARAGELATWGAAFSAEADLLLYGCDLASQADGRALIADLSALTGADVAASDDPTGAARAGGDWVLEQRTGAIEALSAISTAAQAEWQGTMALLARDSFAPNGDLNGTAGGTGWAGAWVDPGTNLKIVSGGLGDPTGLLAESDRAVQLSISGALTTASATRDLANAVGTAGTSTWISFLVRPGNTGLGDYLGIEFGSPSSTVGFAGYNGASFIVGVAGSLSSTAVAGPTPQAGQAALLVLRIDHAAGNDTVTLYVDPTPGTGAPDSAANAKAVVSTMDLGSFTRLAIAGGNGLSSNSARLDELRVGQSFADVTPTVSANAPVITSDGGGASASLNVAENTMAVATVHATDADAGSVLSYSITGGADAAKFIINGATGELRFIAAPNFEAPGDADANNVYDVVVSASDGSRSDSQTMAVSITNVAEPPVANTDSASAVSNVSTPIDVLANDQLGDGPTLAVIDASTPAHGSVTVTATGVDYRSAPGYTGTDAFTYRVSDGSQALTSYLPMNGDASDVIGGNDGTLVGGPTFVAGAYGQALRFDGVNDHVVLPDVAYPSQFTLSVWFRMADNAGTGYRYVYAHDTVGTQGSLNVFFIEDATATGSGAKNVLRTRILDANDADNLAGLDVSATGLADNQWHLYTLTTQTGVGSKVYIDGVQRAAISSGGDAIDPTGPAILGANSTLDSTRFFKGDIDSLQLNATTLSAAQVADLYGGTRGLGNVSVAVTAPPNSAPAITSFGAGSTAASSVAENTTAVSTFTATDADVPTQTLTWSIAGGADAARFAIDNATGALRFVAAPSFEAPTDSGTDNVYDVVVQVSDGSLTDSQALAVTVTDVAESLAVTTVADTVDGDVSSIGALLGNAGADGAISLREALLAANASAGSNQITFAIAGTGVHTIDVQSVLPTITDTVIIDGTTQPGYDGVPLIEINGAAAGTDVNGLVLGAGSSNSVIRGLTINRFEHANIAVASGSGGNTIAGNQIGTTPTGLAAAGGSLWGIDLVGAGAGNLIGGTTAAAANVISGNTLLGGIAINGSQQTTVVGNRIGIGRDGSTAVGNNVGIYLLNDTSGSQIGGVTAAEANVIAGNQSTAIVFDGGSSAAVLGNRIFDNGGMAIDLLANGGIQANDALDGDGGPNGLQNFPVLTRADLDGTDLRIAGTLDSQASSFYRVEFFADTVANSDGHGEGRTFLGFANVSTNPSGRGTFDLHLTASVSAGQVVSATATASNAGFTAYTETSEFALDRTIVATNAAPVILSPATASVAENSTAVATITASDSDLPTQTLTWSITGGADASRFAIDAAAGALRFLAAPNFEAATDAGANHVYDVVVQVSDGSLTDSLAMAVTVTDVNEAPTAAADAYATTATTALRVGAAAGVLANDSDVDGDALVVTTNTTPAHGSVVFAPNGIATPVNLTLNAAVDTRAVWSPGGSKVAFDSNRNGNNDIYVMNADGSGLVRLTANGADDFQAAWSPDGSKIAFTSNRSGTYEVWVMNAADGSGLTQLTNSASSQSRQAVWSPDGSRIAFTSDRNAGSFDVYVMNANGSNVTRLTSVSGDDAEPAWSPDGTKLLFSSMRDGNAEIYVMNADGSGVTRLTNNGALDRAPVWSPDGSRIAFISDRSGSQQVWVMDANGANPLALTAVSGGASYVDWKRDGSALLFTAGNEVQSAALRFSGAFVYTPTAGFVGTDSFTYTSTDPAGLTATATVTVTVGAGSAPSITSNGGGANAAVTIAENTRAVTTVTASDADLPGQTLVYSISGGADAAKFSIDADTGALSFNIAPDHEAPTDNGRDNVYSVIVQVSDGTLTDTQSIAVTVSNVNDNDPVITSGNGATDSVSTPENWPLAALITATDADAGSTLTFSIVGGADAARFGVQSTLGVLYFQATPNFEAPTDVDGNNDYEVVVQVSDGTRTDTQTITVRVTDVNERPVIVSDGGTASAAVTVADRQTAVTTVVANDVDAGSTIVYSISGGADAARFAIDAATGALSFVAAPKFEAPTDAGADNVYEVTVRASDGSLADSQTIAVTVSRTNAPPVITSNGGGDAAAFSVAENRAAITTVTATDPNPGTTLTYSITGGADAARFRIDAATGALAFVAAPDFEQPDDAGGDHVYDVVVQVSDGQATDTQAMAVTVVNENEAPAFVGGATASASVAENTTAVATLQATDVDAATTLVYSIIGGADAARFAIDGATGALTFAAAPDFETPRDGGANNVYDVVVQVSDGELSTTQALAVTVTNANEAPRFAGGDSAAITVNENQTGVTALQASDDDAGTTLAYRIAGGADAARFTIDASTGALRWVNAPNFEAPADANADNRYEVTVAVSDGALVDTQTLTVTVADVAEAPAITTNTLTIIEGGTATPMLASSDEDTAPAARVYTIGNLVAGRFELTSAAGSAITQFTQADVDAGRVRFVHDGSLLAPAYTVSMSDGTQATPAQTADVRFLHVAHAPVAGTPDLGRIAEDTIRVVTAAELLEGASDADGDTLAVASLAIASGQGSLVALGGGQWSFTPAANWNGTVGFDLVLSDGALLATGTATLVVQPVDDAPVITSNSLTLHGASSGGATTLVLVAVDPDTPATALVYQPGNVTGGRFESPAAPGVPLSTFTQAQVDAGGVRFVQDGSGSTPNYTLSVSDGVSASAAPAPTVTSDAPAPAPAVVETIADTLAAPAAELPPTRAPLPATTVVPTTPAAATAATPVRPAEPEPAAPSADAGIGTTADTTSAPSSSASSRGTATITAVAIDAAARTAPDLPATNLAIEPVGDFTSVAVPTLALAGPADTPALDLASALRERSLAEALAPLRREDDGAGLGVSEIAVGGSAVSASLSVGYVLWLARGGVLMASVLAALPAWASLDPLPVLGQVKPRGAGGAAAEDDDEEDDSDAVEQLFSKAPARMAPGTPPEAGR